MSAGSALGCPPASPGSPPARPPTWGAVHPEGLGPGRNGVAGRRVEHILGRFLRKVVACGRTGTEGVLGGQDPPAEPGLCRGLRNDPEHCRRRAPGAPHGAREVTEVGGQCAECKGGIGVGQGPSKAQVSAGPGGQDSPGVSSSEEKAPRLPGCAPSHPNSSSTPAQLRLASGCSSCRWAGPGHCHSPGPGVMVVLVW